MAQNWNSNLSFSQFHLLLYIYRIYIDYKFMKPFIFIRLKYSSNQFGKFLYANTRQLESGYLYVVFVI